MAVVNTITVKIGRRTFNSVDAGFADFERRLAGAIDKSAPKIRKELLKALRLVSKEMVRLHGSPWRPGGSGPALFRRTGGGLRSIARSIRVSTGLRIEQIVGRIGAKFPMSVHERGATVRARRAQFLTIPLPAALDGRGVPLRRRARDWDNTFVARSRRGNLLIFQRRGGAIVPLYVLKREVTIPARLRLEETLRTTGLSFFERRALSVIDRELMRM